ncbi:translation factor GTPase family protein [Persicobacter sp. CCB-QB2]|uniref:elongation factor G n=1 Tax=Persicobacter sp. CCB-QB2 TaxID=1561025 RepID=UPI0006AA0030|nr:elongation factor G [Persicobacter sp. CCB-QB2]
MKVFDQKHIKNIVLLGSTKSGKTTLAETMMFEAGLINRRGKVEEENSVSDYHEIEHQRHSSVYSTLLHTEWRDYKINILDTPGIDDFVGEVVSSVRAADTCLLMVNAQTGVEVGDELVWQQIERFKKPTIFIVNQLDHPKADFEFSVESIFDTFGRNAVLMQYPLQPGQGFHQIIDLLKMVMYVFPEEGGRPEKRPIPEAEQERANDLHNALVEKAAENDERLMDLYFEKGNLEEDELREGLRIGMTNHDVFPIFCLSAKQNMGSGRLMGFIDNVAPASADLKPEPLTDGGELNYDLNGDPTLFFFKTINEPFLGKVSYFKVIAGKITTDQELYNPTTETTERLGQLYIVDGKKRHNVDELVAGDIGVVVKLKHTYTNHTLCLKGKNTILEPITFPEERLRVHIWSESKDENEKLGEALREIALEDPTVRVEFSNELKQLILSAQGDLHLETIKWKLKENYNLSVIWEMPRIPYRETIQRPAEATYRHKKQSGGAGQFGEVLLKIDPYFEGMPEPSKDLHVRHKEEIDLPWGGKLLFYNCIVGGAIDARFVPSIKKGVMEKMEEGPITGSYVRDVRVLVMDGKMHSVDSNDISFKIAGAKAFSSAFAQASPKILEPIYLVEITVPDHQMGDVMTEVQSRRGMILGMNPEDDHQIITTQIPQSELGDFSTSLKSITQGRAQFHWEFQDYQPLPANLQEEMVREATKLMEA